MTFIDNYSRYTKCYHLSYKDEAVEIFMKYKAKVENQLNIKVKEIEI